MIKSRFGIVALAACALLSLAACNTTASAPAAPVPAGDVAATPTQSAALQAGITAEVAFNTAVTAFRAVEPSLTTSTVNAGEALAQKGYGLLKPIRAAVNAGVTPDVSTLTTLTVQLLALVPAAKQ